jgi:AraC family transcriptional regulator
MLLLRSLPDVSTNSPEFHESLRAKCERESCIMWGRARHAEFGPYPQTLSIRAVWGGTQYCHVNGRTVAVDDDSFLILNQGRVYSTSIRAAHPVESLTICFEPALIEPITNEVTAVIEQALDRGSSSAKPSSDFIENLQPHEATVSPILRFIRAHLSRGLADEAWYEEQLVFLLERMRSRQDKLQEQIDQLALIRPATRREVYRRVGLATDFLHTNYAQSVDLGTLAGIAYLSKYHFLRLFTLIHGVTPRSYLQRKRVDVAVRLLKATQLTVSEVALRVGFAYESTLVRQMRRRTRLSPREIRTGARPIIMRAWHPSP